MDYRGWFEVLGWNGVLFLLFTLLFMVWCSYQMFRTKEPPVPYKSNAPEWLDREFDEEIELEIWRKNRQKRNRKSKGR